MADITQILQAAQSGDPNAAEQLMPLVYEELRGLAAAKMAQQPPGQTLQGTALVHEAWIKLTHNPNASWENRAHFFRAAAEAMRHILIDRARSKKSERHGGDYIRVGLTDLDIAENASPEVHLALDEAMTRFAELSPEKAELVKLRFYIGLTNEQASEILGISLATAKRYWTYSRAWLMAELQRAFSVSENKS